MMLLICYAVMLLLIIVFISMFSVEVLNYMQGRLALGLLSTLILVYMRLIGLLAVHWNLMTNQVYLSNKVIR